MKKFLLGILALVLATGTAHAYTFGQAHPQGGSYESEYKVVVKSAVAGVSDAIVVGDVLSYDITNNPDGYTVTRVNANTVQGSALYACVAVQAIATGDASEHRCLSRGYVPQLSYNTNSPSVATVVGSRMCANVSGQAVACSGTTTDGGVNDGKFGTATGNGPIISFQAIPTGNTGSGSTGLKAYVNFQ